MPATAARIALIMNEYRTENSSDAAIQTKHLSSEKAVVSTFLTTLANAATLSAEILAIKKEDRFTWRLQLSSEFKFALTIGESYTIKHPRFGLSSGKKFILRGVRWGSATPIVEALFFGPE